MLRIYKYGVMLLFWIVVILPKAKTQNPNWQAPVSSQYTYTATVIADVQLNDIVSNNGEDRIAFFVGNELRGLSKPVLLSNGNYLHFTTLYANVANEYMEVKVYHKDSDGVYTYAEPIEFKIQAIFGSVDAPVNIKVYADDDAPISVSNIPFQVTIEGLAFNPIDLADYLVQVDDQDVAWTYTPNPNLTVGLTGSILNVSGVTGFSGLTTLTVRATELPMNTTLRNGQSSRATIQHYAEVVIYFYVTPGYLPPAWHQIPNQGIVIGGQFAPTNLHDYEYQYGGPAIQYDYLPIVEESMTPEAKPTWSYINTLATNMTIVSRLDYTPKYQFSHVDDVVAAFINDEIRGVAKLNPTTGLYFITIGGSIGEQDSVTFKFYSGKKKQIITIENQIAYSSYKIEGSIDIPYLLDFAPLRPLVPDYPIAGGYAVMDIEILDTTYLGTESFEFYAFDPMYPNYLRAETAASYCVVSDSSELVILYADMDGDGLGDPNVMILTCSDAVGYVDNGDDCDDTNPLDPSITVSITEASGIPDDGQICANSNVTITASGGISYEWSTSETSSTINVSPLNNTTYYVTVTFAAGCKGVGEASIEVEGKVVRNTQNEGFGSLRNVIECLTSGDTITYDQPLVTHSLLTAAIVIDKNLSIHGLSQLVRPEIQLDDQLGPNSITVEPNRNVTLKNVDIKSIPNSGIALIKNKGNIEIIEIVKFW